MERFGLKRHAVRQIQPSWKRWARWSATIGAVVRAFSARDGAARCGKCWRCMPPARSRCPCRRRGWRRWWPCSATRCGGRRRRRAPRVPQQPALSSRAFRLAGQHGAGPGHRGIRTHPIRFGSLASPGYRERAQEHWAMIHALRDGDRDLMALCRDHLLPSRDAYLASERASSAPSVLSADTPAKSPSRHGVVANPRDTYGYRCGLRLAPTSMDEFRHADVPTGQHTSPPPALLLERTGVRPIGAGAIAAAHFQRHGIRIDDGGVALVVHHHAGNAITAPTMSSWITMNGTEPQ